MKKYRFLASMMALSAGLGIILVSLVSASKAYSNADSGAPATQYQLYFDDQILPDNVMYPVLMAGDRARLELAPPTERITLQVEYAQRRLDFARQLIDKDEHALALTTLTKSQKYLITASQEAMQRDDISLQQKKFLTRSIKRHHKETLELFDEFGSQDKSIVSDLCDQSMSMAQTIDASVDASLN